RLGTRHALVVCSRDGMDEVSLSAPTLVREVKGTAIRAWEWQPSDFGLEPCTLAELKADCVETSARMVRDVLAGKDGPPTRVVLANAAAALIAAGKTTTPVEGVALASNSLRSGRARRVLELLVSAE